MNKDAFLQKSSFFSFNRLKCLRGESVGSSCELCLDNCFKDALTLQNGRFKLDESECTSCASCVGVCPTEALKHAEFDENSFSLKYICSKNSSLSCEGLLKCVGALDVHHYLIIALINDEPLFVNINGCAECEINRGNIVSDRAKKSVYLANEFLKALNIDKKVEISDTAPKSSRRELFSKIRNFKRSNSADSLIYLFDNIKHLEKAPIKHRLLLESLSPFLYGREDILIDLDRFNFLGNREVDGCELSYDCVNFCPTGALMQLGDDKKAYLNFNPSKCINCLVCESVCKKDAIKSAKNISFSKLLMNIHESIFELESEICSICRCSFNKSTPKQSVCSRCQEIEDNCADMMVMAKDIK